jgi:hypothetical protein
MAYLYDRKGGFSKMAGLGVHHTEFRGLEQSSVHWLDPLRQKGKIGYFCCDRVAEVDAAFVTRKKHEQFHVSQVQTFHSQTAHNFPPKKTHFTIHLYIIEHGAVWYQRFTTREGDWDIWRVGQGPVAISVNIPVLVFDWTNYIAQLSLVFQPSIFQQNTANASLKDGMHWPYKPTNSVANAVVWDVTPCGCC